MEGTMLLNYVLLIGLFAAGGFCLGAFARRVTVEARQRAEDAELQLLRRALEEREEAQI